MNIASWLSLLRLLLSPLAIIAAASGLDNGWIWSAGVVTLAGITDFLDGYLARHLGLITALGTKLDLWADKIFIVSMFLTLACLRLIPGWVPVVVAVRELAVTGVRSVLFHGDAPASDNWGKLKTGISLTAIAAVLLRQDLMQGGILSIADAHVPVSGLLALAPWLVLAAVALTVFSGVNYLIRYLRYPNP